MNEQTSDLKDRIISIDALRGFAMFLILSTQIGGAFMISSNIFLDQYSSCPTERKIFLKVNISGSK